MKSCPGFLSCTAPRSAYSSANIVTTRGRITAMLSTLFAPRPEHAPRYVRAVSRLAGDDAHKKLAVTHLTLLYMGHLRGAGGRAREFVAAFVLAGGLVALAAVSTHANLHVRAQAVESLKLVLCGDDDGDDELIDWFADERGAHAAARRQSALNERLLALADEATGFVSGLLANRADSYPGGGLACLNILAFWLSWARQQRCANRRLQLSRGRQTRTRRATAESTCRRR